MQLSFKIKIKLCPFLNNFCITQHTGHIYVLFLLLDLHTLCFSTHASANLQEQKLWNKFFWVGNGDFCMGLSKSESNGLFLLHLAIIKHYFRCTNVKRCLTIFFKFPCLIKFSNVHKNFLFFTSYSRKRCFKSWFIVSLMRCFEYEENTIFFLCILYFENIFFGCYFLWTFMQWRSCNFQVDQF